MIPCLECAMNHLMLAKTYAQEARKFKFPLPPKFIAIIDGYIQAVIQLQRIHGKVVCPIEHDDVQEIPIKHVVQHSV